MRIHREWIKMHSGAYVDQARGWARMLEDREAARSGQPLANARRSVASSLGLPAGTLENLRRGRLKAVAAHLYDRLCAGVIRELEAEVTCLEHELQILRASGSDPRDHEIDAVVASLAKARATLEERARP